MMKLIKLLTLTFLITLMTVGTVSAQIERSDLLRTWTVYKYELEKGRHLDIPEESKGDFLHLNEDSTYHRLDSGKFKVDGNWQLDTDNSQLILEQEMNREYPSVITMKIVKLSPLELIVEVKDANGRPMRIFSRPSD